MSRQKKKNKQKYKVRTIRNEKTESQYPFPHFVCQAAMTLNSFDVEYYFSVFLSN